MYDGEIDDNRGESEDLELHADALRHAVIHRLDDG